MAKAKKRGKKAESVRKFLADAVPDIDPAMLKRALPLSLDAIAQRFKSSRGRALDALDKLKTRGVMVREFGGVWSLMREPEPPSEAFSITSDKDGHYRFGVISDTHYGSKYAREDVCDALYDWFAEEGIERVMHAGNWIDGEARFNKYDLIPEAHGMQAQLDYFIERYPQRKGITTYYVAGDDHEGWYSQREGIDIGRALEDTARNAGRSDLVNLGYMEAFVTLIHHKSRNTSKLLLMHPGGGSAYATSYAPQKIVEAMQSGEKPGVVILGHLHKIEYLNIRGVHVIQAGCTKDLDPFGRKKRLQYHLGGWIIDLWQDPQGAISRCRPDLRQFFDRGYYNGQFSMSGPVTKVKVQKVQR
jgi:predicted phosphodiesterase